MERDRKGNGEMEEAEGKEKEKNDSVAACRAETVEIGEIASSDGPGGHTMGGDSHREHRLFMVHLAITVGTHRVSARPDDDNRKCAIR